MENMQDITNSNKKAGDHFRDVLNLDWVFTSHTEKIILTVLLVLGIWKIVDFLIALS